MLMIVSPVSFSKMHGIGNDFVIIDQRIAPVTLTVPLIRALCHRHKGIGCDQLVTIDKPTHLQAMAYVRFYNPDGSESGACGNATRCVAHTLMREHKLDQVTLQTQHGLLACAMSGQQVTVNMGQATIDNLHLNAEGIEDGIVVQIGNPHLVMKVDHVDAYPLIKIGSSLEHHRLFPNRVNVNILEILDRHTIKLRVWERGAGETLACGSGACASTVAALRRGWTGHHVRVLLPGGELSIDVRDDNTVYMTGDVAYVFEGTWHG